MEPLQPQVASTRSDDDSNADLTNANSSRQRNSDSHRDSLQSVGNDTERIRVDSYANTQDDQDVYGDSEDVLEDQDAEHDQDGHDHEMDGGDTEDQSQPIRGSQDANAEGVEQESDMELDLLAESESDSDDQSNLNDAASSVAQRSIQTHATAGSDAGGGVGNLALFSEDDSDDSTQQVTILLCL